MGFFDFLSQGESRASIESPTMPLSAANIADFIALSGLSASGVKVNIENALGVPAIWDAVNFLSGTMAGLPLHVYRRGSDGRKRVRTGVAPILGTAVNDEMTSFDWRKYVFDQVFTQGRGLTFIERNKGGRVINLWPLEPKKTTIERVNGRKRYLYKDGGKTWKYEASEVLDIPFMLGDDLLQHRSPILQNKDTVGLAIAVTEYASRFFQNGGVPPFVVTGNFQTGKAMERAADDLAAAVRKAAKEARQALVLPPNHDLKQVGADPEKMQMVEAQRFIIEQIARIYALPPIFLQDLTHGTYSNTEQQDLHLVKHTVRRWVEQAEQEINLKIFGRGNSNLYAEFALDGLLRGDFKARMEGYAQGVQNGIFKPNECRERENLPTDPQGDKLMIQGATVAIGEQENDQDAE